VGENVFPHTRYRYPVYRSGGRNLLRILSTPAATDDVTIILCNLRAEECRFSNGHGRRLVSIGLRVRKTLYIIYHRRRHRRII